MIVYIVAQAWLKEEGGAMLLIDEVFMDEQKANEYAQGQNEILRKVNPDAMFAVFARKVADSK